MINTIDEIFVISFYNNEDRINNINEMQEKFSKKFTIIKPIKDVYPERSLLKTNLKIWLDNFDKNILIFEDDFFTRYTKDEIQIKLNCFYEQVDYFDILLLGGDVYRGEYANPDLIKVNNFTETHAILYNKNILSKLFSKIAPEILNKNVHIDQVLSNYVCEENLKCFAISPFLFTQRNFTSLINNINQINHKYDIDHLFKKEFDDNSIKIVEFKFNNNDFYIKYFLKKEVNQALEVKILAVDINSGIRILDHDMTLVNGIDYYNRSGRFLSLKDEVFFEIYHNNKILIRKKIKKINHSNE